MRRYSRQGHLTSKIDHLLATATRNDAPVATRPVRASGHWRPDEASRAAIGSSYARGATVAALAREHSLSEFSVRKLLVCAGAMPLTAYLSAKQIKEIHVLRAGGLSKMAIARRLGVSDGTVRIVLAAGDHEASFEEP